MSILNRMKAGWKTMTPVEKVKTVIRLMCGVGGGFLGGELFNVARGGVKSKAGNACLYMTCWGLGGYLGDKAADNLNETIDSVIELNEMRKQMQNEKKEGQANG